MAELVFGDLGAGAEDEEVHSSIGDLFRDLGTYLCGRRMYETMVSWETAQWPVSGPGSSGRSTPTRCAGSRRGPIATSPVVTTTLVGGGTCFFPDGVRLDLGPVGERAFRSGLVHVHYRAR